MTVSHIVLHDTRLAGTVVYEHEGMDVINATHLSLHAMAEAIRNATTNRVSSHHQMAANPLRDERTPASVLTLIGHGADVVGEDGRQAVGADVDWAIQIGSLIHRYNAQEFGRMIRGSITDRIRVLCCHAARSVDARATCAALAAGAGVDVYAATTEQILAMQPVRRFMRSPLWYADFGPWEGTVVRYTPSGGEIIEFEGRNPEEERARINAEMQRG